MATYNWKYTSGYVYQVIPPNGNTMTSFTVPVTADDVRPDEYVYIALFGNDITGNGSRMYPVRTIQRAKQIAKKLVFSSGVWRENYSAEYNDFLLADGDVVVDFLFYLNHFNGSTMKDIKFKNIPNGLIRNNSGCFLSPGNNTSVDIYGTVYKSIYKDFTSFNFTDGGDINATNGNNTYVNISNFRMQAGINSQGCLWHSIFDNCNITFLSEPNIDYSLFNNCRVRFVDSGEYTLLESKEQLMQMLLTFYPNSKSFKNCLVSDPKFNNPSVDDFSLALDSPAKNRSYFGTFIGAKSIGYAIKARENGVLGDFDLSTNVNLIIEDDSIRMADVSLLASIESVVKTNLIARELAEAPIYGFYADRNGQYIDTIPDLSVDTVNPSQSLKVRTPYIVEIGAITYNGAVYTAGQRFTTTAVTSFQTDAGGICREIIEAPQRHTILARFYDGGMIKNAGDALVAGYWYYAIGSITYNGVVYTETTFKALDTSSFSGVGQVREAMTNQLYQHYEPNVKFTSNNLGDVRTGVIVRGNGDPNYERGAGKEFPINARFIQIKYILQPNNLKP